MKERYCVPVACYLILIDDKGRVLLSRRANTGWADGTYSLVSGHVEKGESASVAMVREAKEEVDIIIDSSALAHIHTLHRFIANNPESTQTYIDLFFAARAWRGEVTNCEPEKCDDLLWADVADLPTTVLPIISHVLLQWQKGVHYSELGF